MCHVKKNFWMLILLLFALQPLFGQFAAQQRIVGFTVMGSYGNKYTGDSYFRNSNGTFSDENQRTDFNISNSFGLEKLISNTYATGYNFFLYYRMSLEDNKRIDSLNRSYEKFKSRSQNFSLGSGKSFRWIIPIGKKFGCDLMQHTNVLLGLGNSNFIKDSSDGYNELWSKGKNGFGNIYASLNLGLYYWVTPKIILRTSVSIASAYIGVSTYKYNGSSPEYTNIYYNTDMSFIFTNSRHLLNQSIGISFLLN
ncbi:MAG: hypothetical protein SGJ00_05160 [bacterium]|nr:hypothetical protein [bacterium]